MKNTNKILILGSIGLDTIQTKYGKKENLLGGSATYATIAAGIHGSVIPLGIVGDDFPKEGYDIFSKYSININNIETKTGSTFRWGGKYHDDGDDRDTLFTKLGVFEHFDPVISESDSNVSYLFLANIHPALQMSVLKQCTKTPIVITDTMNLWINTTPDELTSLINKTNILLINESEIIELTKSADIKTAAHKVLSMGPEKIIIKLGSKGAKCFSNSNEEISIGVYPVSKVVDPTGAGDVFG
ncbi:MAG: PfkB family carbohydrate kinase, partial [Candidatus Marinimicrobia bacterium]|nr:PfkB family carbohydrate kinase [Candidatus Neomarinimicrobiota bacterium]